MEEDRFDDEGDSSHERERTDHRLLETREAVASAGPSARRFRVA